MAKRGRAARRAPTNTHSIFERERQEFLDRLRNNGLSAEPVYDTKGALHGKVIDEDNQLFKVGRSPFFFHFKSRGGIRSGIHPSDIDTIKTVARTLEIPGTSLYFVVGFFGRGDPGKRQFFVIPFERLYLYKYGDNDTYRFSLKYCRVSTRWGAHITFEI